MDVDYEQLMAKKRDMIVETKELRDMLPGAKACSSEEAVLIRSEPYLGVGCDLRNLGKLDKALKNEINTEECLILCTAEVSVTYMDVDAADALIKWASSLPNGQCDSMAHKTDSADAINSKILSS